MEDTVAALSVTLTPEEIAFLEEKYVAHQIVGFNINEIRSKKFNYYRL